MHLALICLIPLMAAFAPAVAIRWGRTACAVSAGLASSAALVLLLMQAPGVYAGTPARVAFEWLPQVGLSASFFIDGLSLFFATMILVIGLLVIVYARFYLAAEDPMGRFFAYLLLFQGAMLGVVISDNILLLAVFWELTSLSSFLLIGYWRHEPDARRGARMALVVTGSGGLALIGGFLLLGQAAGSYEISEIIQRGDQIKAHALYPAALGLILLGAFTKSAQFPFHFWLPHAMAAPTPVSAYLHSATMVKAGVFLLARLWPALSGTELWFIAVAGVGAVTMLVGAWFALFKSDLKAILAYSTISHLGLMVMLLGFGTPFAALAAVFHILNHATFKAALFMSAGIVDHETGTRDIGRLGGLLRLMPISGALAVVATAAMAGMPPLNGFLSKEMMLEAAYTTRYGGLAWLMPVLATLAALLSVGYSVRYAIGVYLGPHRGPTPKHAHEAPFGLWAPVAALVCLVVAIGLAPMVVAGDVVVQTARAVIGAAPPVYTLSLWHGFTPALGMSALAFVGGYFAYRGYLSLDRVRLAGPRLDARGMFEASMECAVAGARRVTGSLHSDSLPAYFGFIIGAIIIVGFVAFMGATHAAGARAMQPVNAAAVASWLVLVAACGILVRLHHDRLLALIVVSVVGLVVSLAFLMFSAPDLALTQISVEIVTTVLLLLALNLLPRTEPQEARPAGVLRNGALAIAGGVAVAGLAYAIMTRDFTTISDYHLAQSKPLGGGTNVVNVILVDFRGFDTFGEIIVLCVAALAIYALLDNALTGAAARRLAAMKQGLESGDAHPVLLVVVARVLLPMSVVVGAFIFLRGHNLPGGGFIAGLVVAIALIMQAVAGGYRWAARASGLNAHVMLGWGVLIAGATGMGAILLGRPFLTSAFGYLGVPLVGDVEIASAIAFDIGVFVTVVGVVILSLAQISRVEARAERLPTPEGPMDHAFEPAAPAREG